MKKQLIIKKVFHVNSPGIHNIVGKLWSYSTSGGTVRPIFFGQFENINGKTIINISVF
jgi:hypothetical protein